MDGVLDAATSGPVWLKDPRIARVVVSTLRIGETDKQLYRLAACENRAMAMVECARAGRLRESSIVVWEQDKLKLIPQTS
jgi:hypothetical protein